MERIPIPARRVLERLEGAGFAAYLVGGCVRDLLRGCAPGDWDMTTAAPPQEMLSLFGAQARPTGLKHGTVTVTEAGMHFEITTFRVDGGYTDHRHPEHVTFTACLAEDLKRRDFTVNAMAMDRHGALTDLFGGQRDLQNRVLRCVGAPEQRFDEDALRILRLLRFSSSLGFTAEEATAAAAREKAPLLREIAAERIRAELLKLLCGQDVVRVLLTYPEILDVFLPEIRAAVGCDQRNPHHCYDVWEHIARTVGYVPVTDVLRMTMLLHDLGKPACMTLDEAGVGHFKGHAEVSCALGETILRRLRFDRESTERILKLVKWHDAPIEPTQRAMRRVLHKMGVQGTRDLLEVKRADNLAQAPAYRGRQAQIETLRRLLESILEQDACFSLKQLAVRGGDLLALGLRGPEIGRSLQFLLDAVIDGTLPNERDALRDALKTKKEQEYEKENCSHSCHKSID